MNKVIKVLSCVVLIFFAEYAIGPVRSFKPGVVVASGVAELDKTKWVSWSDWAACSHAPLNQSIGGLLSRLADNGIPFAAVRQSGPVVVVRFGRSLAAFLVDEFDAGDLDIRIAWGDLGQRIYLGFGYVSPDTIAVLKEAYDWDGKIGSMQF